MWRLGSALGDAAGPGSSTAKARKAQRETICEFPKIGGGNLFWGPYNRDPPI